MRTLLLVGSVLLAATVGATDLVVHQRLSNGLPGSGASTETVYLAGDKMVTDAGTTRTIVDLAKQTITSIDVTKRTYTVVTFDDLTAQMDALKKSLESLPPEARRQMGALFDEGGPVTVTPSGKTERIAGYDAKEYVLKGGQYSGSVWATDAIATPAAFAKWKRIEQSRGGAGRQLGEAMSRITGFPLRTRIEAKAGPRSMVLSNEVLDVKEGAPPAEMLVVPAGFTKQAFGAAAGER